MNVIESIPQWFKAMPQGHAWQEAQQEETRAQRQVRVDQLIALRRERLKTIAHRDKTIEPLRVAAVAAQEAAQSASDKLVAAQQRHRADVSQLEREAGKIECELRASADPRIAEACHAMNARLDSGRNSMARSGQVDSGQQNVGSPQRIILYRLRVLGQWFDGIHFYAAASSPRRSRRTWAGLR